MSGEPGFQSALREAFETHARPRPFDRLHAVPGEIPVGLDAVAEHHWRLAPHLCGAHITRFDAEPYLTPRHIRYIGGRIAQAVAQGRRYILVNLPVQVGKSWLCSLHTPTWFLHITDGRGRVLLASYEANFAGDWGRKVRNMIDVHGDELGIALSKDSAAATDFTVTGGGEMHTAGIGGAFAGRPGDLIVIDDPHKNFEDAHSKASRTAVWNWFLSVALGRRQPQTVMIIIQTRWHVEDLTGMILASPMADEWELIRIPALCDDPVNDPLGRHLGESIWPERYDEDWYEQTRITMGQYIWTGVYQQRPAPVAGNLFKRETWRYANAVPNTCRFVRSWDFAGTESNSADYTVGILMAWEPTTKAVYVLDVIRGRYDVSVLDDLLVATAALDRARYGKKIRIRLEQEGGSSGKKWAKSQIGLLSGYQVNAEAPDNNKFVRALPFAAQQQAGNVFIVSTEHPTYGWQPPTWAQEYVEELALFDNGPHDDQVDASSAGYDELVNGPGPAKVRLSSAADVVV